MLVFLGNGLIGLPGRRVLIGCLKVEQEVAEGVVGCVFTAAAFSVPAG